MRIKFYYILVLFIILLTVSCGASSSQSVTRGAIFEENEKMFIGVGKAKDFAQAKNLAYADLMKNAVISVIGENEFNINYSSLENNILNYNKARKYILGEMKSTTPDKDRKWIENYRDTDGDLVLKLQAWVDLKTLKEDLSIYRTVESSPTTKSDLTGVGSYADSKVSQKIGADTKRDDLKNVDISTLTMLVYYNPESPQLKKNPDEQQYAKWAVDWINRELASKGVKVFDLETMEKLVKERNLIQEANTGNVGIGLLLAQKVFAELYAEVSPLVTYDGEKANVILNVKVFVRTTGALIATMDKGSGYLMYQTSPTDAIKAGMKLASKKIMDELEINLKKYINGGRFYNVTLMGVSSYKDASKFSSLVSKMEGVINITLKSGSKEDMTYIYDIQYKGTPNQLVDKLFELLEGKPGFEKFDLNNIRGNELTFTLN